MKNYDYEILEFQKLVNKLFVRTSRIMDFPGKNFKNKPFHSLVSSLAEVRDILNSSWTPSRSVDLNEAETASLIRINSELKNIQFKIQEEYESVCANLRSFENNDPEERDVEIEIEIYFCLKEDDPDYDEDLDNFVADYLSYANYRNNRLVFLGDGYKYPGLPESHP